MEFNIVDLAKSINGYFGAAGPTMLGSGCQDMSSLCLSGRLHFPKEVAPCPGTALFALGFVSAALSSMLTAPCHGLSFDGLVPKAGGGWGRVGGPAQVVIGAALAFEGLLLQPFREQEHVSM